MEPISGATRPRNVDWKRAAALLYGDWGTSKAYVTGIAFAIAAYSSFWYVAAVGVLMALVGLNYIWICKYFPEGGGVYSAAKVHGRTIALIGGFLLVADYIVTASLSCYDAFLYLGFGLEDAKRWSILTIFIIGVINFFGPRHSGSLAMLLGGATVTVVVLLGAACVPHLPQALAAVQSPHRDPLQWWTAFVGMVLALSGVEAIANTTGVMQLDPGSTPAHPSVARTARRAILVVMAEVCVFTVLFGLAMHAIPGMDPRAREGDMLRHLGEVFVDSALKGHDWPLLSWVGTSGLFSWAVGVVFGLLLLSATNTAIVALVSVLYLMCKDGEMPHQFGVLNRFGVPWILMFIAILAPILVIDVQPTEHAVHGLAAMYAIGVVGAIAINLGSCALNFRLPMRRHERIIMMATFVLAAAIEVTIAATKHAALAFALVVLGTGFLMRSLHRGVRLPAFLRPCIERLSDWAHAHNIPVPAALSRLKRLLLPHIVAEGALAKPPAEVMAALSRQLGPERPVTAIMVAARGVTPTLRFAMDQARLHNAALYVLFVREVFTTIPTPHREEEDAEAQAVFQAARAIADGVNVSTIYAVSDDLAWTILDHAAMTGVDMLILGHSRRTAFTRLLRGNLLEQIGSQLPEEIRLLVVG
ncbi:MAG: amino acid permease [Verrucomicrobiae bacterium]|nr:amino acid permease [Verrucomicrobiae bacterium]